MSYNSSLDGLRGLAILVVAAFHAKVPSFTGGFLGVDIFFVLSGFLITAILYEQISRSGELDFLSFYWRRFIRLYPALSLCLILYLMLAPLAWPRYVDHFSDVMLSFFHIVDFSKSLFDKPRYLSHIWSLSVEVHFYLIWPMIILALTKIGPSSAMKMLMILFVGATAWRFFLLYDIGWADTYYRFDSRLSGFVAGALILLVSKNVEIVRVKPFYGLIGGSLILVSVCFGGWKESGALTFGVLGAEVGAAALIFFLQKSGAGWILGCGPLVYLGRLSYGIYLFHYPLMVWLRANYNWQMTFFLGFAVAFMLAAFSYHTIEATFRNKKFKSRL